MIKRTCALILTVLPAASMSSMGNISLHPAQSIRADAAAIQHLGEIPLTQGHKRPEEQLIRVISFMRQGDLENAQRMLNQLLTEYPNYKLAHLIQGDLLLARQQPISNLGNLTAIQQDALNDLRHEAKVRIGHYTADVPADQIPANVVKMSPAQRYLLAVDVTKSRMYVYENDNGLPKRVDDFYITIGKNGYDKYVEGDQRTPLGVYFVTSELPKSTLPDMYGDAAFPLNYPNEWDRREGRTGHGIWLHGSPSGTYSRPPLSSNGCVALTNPDLNALKKYLQVGVTPVIISKQFNWVNSLENHKTKQVLESQVEQWRKDWESLDTNRYLTHYANTFKSGAMDLAAWKAQKMAVNATRKWVKVKVDNLSLLAYPGKPDLMVATFEQSYQSNVASGTSMKRQYWQRIDGNWKIVFEDAS
ncbi:L,D-transpeptidase Cds6 family protein [Leeia oryzae]|uniref:L,D-transpeptidase Cds6 family protein n=1 Tax=Leeia oryzae TaxID=356662 RepID=UPI0003763442|nr:L,D-transpeptidase family protein [Leeia oryzae]